MPPGLAILRERPSTQPSAVTMTIFFVASGNCSARTPPRTIETRAAIIGVRRIEATSRPAMQAIIPPPALSALRLGGFVSRVTLPVLDAVTLEAACRQMLADARAAFDRITALSLDEVTSTNVLDPWDAIAIALENIEGPIAILNNVHPDKSVRDAADAAVRSLSSFQVEI